MDTEVLIKTVMDCAHDVHRVIKPGVLELLYKRALAYELDCKGLNYELEKEIPAVYKGKLIGTFKADIIVEGKLILELKATTELTDSNRCQLVTYLTLSGIEDGLLINFGTPLLQMERKFRTYRPTRSILNLKDRN